MISNFKIWLRRTLCVSGFQDFKISRFQDFKVTGFQVFRDYIRFVAVVFGAWVLFNAGGFALEEHRRLTIQCRYCSNCCCHNSVPFVFYVSRNLYLSCLSGRASAKTVKIFVSFCLMFLFLICLLIVCISNFKISGFLISRFQDFKFQDLFLRILRVLREVISGFLISRFLISRFQDFKISGFISAYSACSAWGDFRIWLRLILCISGFQGFLNMYYNFNPPSEGVRNWKVVLSSALVISRSPKVITSMPTMTS